MTQIESVNEKGEYVMPSGGLLKDLWKEWIAAHYAWCKPTRQLDGSLRPTREEAVAESNRILEEAHTPIAEI